MTWREYFKENLDIDEMPKEFADKEITVEDCLKIIDGMSFTIKELLEKTKWHTGMPTEEGWYRCFTESPAYPYQHIFFKDYEWHARVGIVAWQKVEPYKG